jgi:hypothetical protein
MIRAINAFGPPVGKYDPSVSTDIRRTFRRLRKNSTASVGAMRAAPAREPRNAAAATGRATDMVTGTIIAGDELHPSLAGLMAGWTAEEEQVWLDMDARR